MANSNMAIARPVALAFLGCTLAGCVVGPNFVKPKPSVPPQWSPTAVTNGTAGAARVTSERAQTVAWWSSFNDATLTALVQQSAAQNLDIKQAVLRIEEAQAQTAVVAGGLWPSASANASWTRQRLSTNTPNGAIFGFNFPDLPPTLVNPYNQYQLGLGASWTLDVFGGQRRSVEAANAQMEAAVEGAHAALLSMVSDVAATYIDLRGAQLRRKILERSLATQRDLLQLTRDRRNAGLTSDLDVENALAEVGTTQAEVPLADRQITVDINELSELMARPPEALRAELVGAQPLPPPPPVVPIGLPSDLARRRPDVRQAEANLHAATAEIGVAVSNYFPQLTLTAAGGFQSEGLSQLVDTASHFASFGPAIQLPIFEGGRLHAEVQLQKVKAKEAAVDVCADGADGLAPGRGRVGGLWHRSGAGHIAEDGGDGEPRGPPARAAALSKRSCKLHRCPRRRADRGAERVVARGCHDDGVVRPRAALSRARRGLGKRRRRRVCSSPVTVPQHAPRAV